jgi:hypothetical protein
MDSILLKKELKGLWILHHIQMYGFDEFTVEMKPGTQTSGMSRPQCVPRGFAGFMVAE